MLRPITSTFFHVRFPYDKHKWPIHSLISVLLTCTLIENIVIETRNLTTPHPRYKERRFVLEPLMELYPDGHFYGYSFYGLSEKIKNQAIKKL